MALMFPQTGDVIFVHRSVKPIVEYQRAKGRGTRPDVTHAAIVVDHDTLFEAQAVTKTDKKLRPGKASVAPIASWKRARAEDETQFTVLRRKCDLTTEERIAVMKAANYHAGAAYALKEVLREIPTPDGRAVCSGLVAKVLNKAEIANFSRTLSRREPLPSELYDLLLENDFASVDLKNYWSNTNKTCLDGIGMLQMLAEQEEMLWQFAKRQIESPWKGVGAFALGLLKESDPEHLFYSFRKNNGLSAVEMTFQQMELLWKFALVFQHKKDGTRPPHFSERHELDRVRKSQFDVFRMQNEFACQFVLKVLDLAQSYSGADSLTRAYAELYYCFLLLTDVELKSFTGNEAILEFTLSDTYWGHELPSDGPMLAALHELLNKTAQNIRTRILSMHEFGSAIRLELASVDESALLSLERQIEALYRNDITQPAQFPTAAPHLSHLPDTPADLPASRAVTTSL